MAKLWELLKWQAKKYSAGNSTSMSIERAKELFSSLVYTLSSVAYEKGIPSEELLQRDFQDIIQCGQSMLEEKRNAGEVAWNELCREAPQINNVYYVSTIKNLGLFFKRYEIYYDAHQIPCSIDYPLLNLVSEEQKGISFIEEYMGKIKIENQFIHAFPLDTVLDLLKKVTTDYQEDYMNLCEPVLVHAIGRVLLGYPLHSLTISQKDVDKLHQCVFDGKAKEEIFKLLSDSVEIASLQISVHESWYFAEEIKSLATRIDAAVKTGCLANIFIPTAC